MRKSPTISDRICNGCGEVYTPKGNSQQYCDSCRKMRRIESQHRYEKKKFPNRKQKSKCTDPCCVCGGVFSSHFGGKPYCNKHYQSMIMYGQPYGKRRENTNTFFFGEDCLHIITQSGEEILADIADYDTLKKHSWCISKTGYAVANINGKVTKLHRYLLGLTDQCDVVDHKNHNTLDNRRSNLRVCTQLQNAMNQRPNKGNKHLGVRLLPTGKYNARIFVGRKGIHIGNFDTLEEAIEARIKAEEKYCGEFGYHNSIKE